MGAGTGTLESSDDRYNVTLNFDGLGIAQADPIYTNFRSALEWLLTGLRAVQARGSYTENTEGQRVTSISVLVQGPLSGTDRENFNRAFNRLLWGARFRRSPDEPSASNRTVTPSDTRYIDEQT